MAASKSKTPEDIKTVPEEFFTLEEAAAQIGRDVRTLQRWHSMRVGPPRIKIGNLVLYRKETFFAWLAAQEEVAPLRA